MPSAHPSRAALPFASLPAAVDLPAIEAVVLERWRHEDVFRATLERTADGPTWIFYEGPPTANGHPGTHHVEARVFKDVFPRFKTMKGFHVERRAGWDCHGLPVELAVEKELGFSTKQDIEAFGIAEFNARCRESVLRHVDEFERLTERMGYWVDLGAAYRTMDPDYIESVWWSLQRIFDSGLLVEDQRVTPYCPRCETGLSDHEVAQGYTTVVDPSVFVRFPITSGPLAEQNADLLVWTTTPWTLVSNTAVAVHPDVTYVVARAGGHVLVVAEPLLRATLGEEAEVLSSLPGRALEGTAYQRPFELVDVPGSEAGRAHYVVLADYVTIEDGTGLVHQAPAFGAEDLGVARIYGLPVVNPVGTDGRFGADVPLVGGQFFKTADKALVEDLRERGILWHYEPHEHSYPLCWRCDTPLLYYALPSWYIRTTAIRERLLAENQRTNWYPPRIKDGRYGDWLANNVDWALSRNRFWGTPLPVWRCGADRAHLTCVGSLTELSELAGRDVTDLDPHRPFIDQVSVPCRECGAEARRVPEVIDGWYDSGAMPFAQWGAPFRNEDQFADSYPAQFICEGIDQTRGWFYTLMAVGTLVFDRSSYENVLCLGLLLDAEGRKMSKHFGNVLDPFDLFERHGADAVRWLMLAAGSPWSDRRVGHEGMEEIVRKVLLTYYNTASFLTLYANATGWWPGKEPVPPPAERSVLDRGAISELHRLAADVDTALENFDTLTAGRRMGDFIEGLSNWYVRRSRRRFWNGDPAALETLHECLDVLTRLLAPYIPFLTEHVWHALGHEESVHLQPWPQADESLIDPENVARIQLGRRIIELGRAARAASGVKTRQPLGRVLISSPRYASIGPELRAQIADELNVESIEPLASEPVDVTVKPNFRALGKRFGKRTPQVAQAVATAGRPGSDGTLTVEVDGERIVLGPDELLVTETPQTGWAVASEAGTTVALDLTITPELRRAGLARDAIRLMQSGRKDTGLDISDRVEVWWRAEDGAVAAALREYSDTIADEVLAVSFVEDGPPVNLRAHRDGELGLTFWLRVAGG